MAKKKRVTLRDVARQAGVSPTAVSFAYNAPHQLSPSTRDRILATALELGYQPHPVARTLATGRTNTIGFVMASSLNWMLHDPLFSIVLGEVGAVCDEYKLHVLLVPARADRSPSGLASIAADGFLMVAIHREHPLGSAAERTSRPVVLLDGDERIRVPQLNVDDVAGAYAAARHLLDKGHRHIAVATAELRPGAAPIPYLQRRLQGYQQAVAEAGLPPSVLQVVYTRGLLAVGVESFQRIWSLDPRPTAVLCSSDVRALGILRGARVAGINVPGDLAVVGFDDLPDAAVSRPPLTTVHHDLAARVRRGVEQLIALIQDKSEEPVDEELLLTPTIFATDLIVRQSS